MFRVYDIVAHGTSMDYLPGRCSFCTKADSKKHKTQYEYKKHDWSTMYFEFETAPNGPNANLFYEGLSIRCTALKIAIKLLEQKERSLTV